MRSKNLINYAHLNDCKGDMSKKWYVEYSFILPGHEDTFRFRVYDGLCSGTEADRRAAAAKLIEKINLYLKSGEYLQHPDNYNSVRSQDTYRPEAEAYNAVEKDLQIDVLVAKFLKHGRAGWSDKTESDYKSKLKYFQEWASTVNLRILDVDRKQLQPFFYWYVENRHISRASVKKTGQVMRIFFDWLEDEGIRPEGTNPATKIPKIGEVVDMSSVPFTTDERQLMKSVISVREPWIWLACEMQYYCAIRPGTELRLARIKDIDLEHKTITIPCGQAKARRTDVVGLPDIIVEHMKRLALFQWPKEYYIFGACNSPGARPYGKNTMRNRFNKYRDELGIPADRKFYSWKHTGAIEAVDNGISVWDLKQHMRHKSIRTTEEYLQRRSPDVHAPGKYIGDI